MIGFVSLKKVFNFVYRKPVVPLICTVYLILLFGGLQLQAAIAVEVYSKDDAPFGISQGEWLGRFWQWWITTTVDELLQSQTDV